MLKVSSVPRPLVMALDRLSRRRGVSRSRLIISVLADYVVEFLPVRRFETIRRTEDKVIVADHLLQKIVKVRLRPFIFCDYCRTQFCGHARYARRLILSKQTTLDHLIQGHDRT